MARPNGHDRPQGGAIELSTLAKEKFDHLSSLGPEELSAYFEEQRRQPLIAADLDKLSPEEVSALVRELDAEDVLAEIEADYAFAYHVALGLHEDAIEAERTGQFIWLPDGQAMTGPEAETDFAKVIAPHVAEMRRAQMQDQASERPVIRVEAGALHDLATKGEAALLAAGAPFYVRGAQIVRPIVEEVEAARGHKTKTARLAPVSPDMLVDHLSRVADWEKFNARAKAFVPTDPPRSVATTIQSRDGEWTFSPLAGVITTPTMKPDGSLLATPGYDPATRLILLDPPPLPPLPALPDREDALGALALLEELLLEFPFVDDASRSVALSALITPVVRGAMPVAPLHASRAPAAGSGKSYMIDVASALSNGQRCPVIAVGRSEEETEKRLGAAMLAGYPNISIDNVNGTLGGDALCQLVERPRVAIRPLGRSELVVIETRATVFATGNNIQPTGDLIRRIIMCSLDPNLERPELRTFRGDPLATVLRSRGRYIAAAMTVVRAWLNRKEPDPVPPLASFEGWSHTVRSALVWLGKADPVLSMNTARDEDPEIMVFHAVIAAWQKAAGLDNPLTTGALKDLAEKSQTTTAGEYYNRGESYLAHPELHQALLDAAGWRGAIDPRRLGYFLTRHKDRIREGTKLIGQEDRRLKQKTWSLVRVG